MVESSPIAERLARHRDAIVKRWCDHIVEEYPQRTAAFLKDQRDPFANPAAFLRRTDAGGVFVMKLKVLSW